MNATAPITYVIRVRGHLDGDRSASLAGLSITRDSGDTTTITGLIADKAQLHRALAALGETGATLLELRTLEPRTDETQTDSHPGTTCAVLERPLHTERLTLRPAILTDADITWKFRQLDSVNEWLTGCPSDIAGYRGLWSDRARLATTVVIQLGRDRDAEVIGDFMLRREDAWAQLEMANKLEACRQSSASCSTPPTRATDTLPKPSANSCATPSRTSRCGGLSPTVSSTTTHPGGSWNA